MICRTIVDGLLAVMQQMMRVKLDFADAKRIPSVQHVQERASSDIAKAQHRLQSIAVASMRGKDSVVPATF